MLTLGVEEEFLLLEPDGALAPAAPAVVSRAGCAEQIKPEFMAYQVETATTVVTDLAELRRELGRLRLIAADAADRLGVRLVAAGTAPLDTGPPVVVSDLERYRELARRFPEAAAHGTACGCHVHIGVPDRELAAAVLTRMRPWLPALLALTVNSPIARGVDTGWASHRYHAQHYWPTFRPPGVWAGAERYDEAVRALVANGAAMDPQGIYFLARLSPRFPTIEVRVGDTLLDPLDTVVFAGVVRALVATLIGDVRGRVKILPEPDATIRARLMNAAFGHTDPAALLARITPELDRAGDTGEVYAGFERLRRGGTGAQRQRRLWRAYGPTKAFVDALAEATTPVAAIRQPPSRRDFCTSNSESVSTPWALSSPS
ncbi:carboxylate-amine ligase [Paractinoplanes brasiliensis]|uniref:Putative glutamate--cysteine ligase 2 n=1 Tax=Paractinoplanes brasiliensis TaxID=52695 RepID=A0A4R6J8H2_9ACTN|nr:YbdK family carboxylate-amine ligase [Actinoplanes brasiliensis]TDO31457.1 carboxylate-amine ligase [Actinoplanes brasiliensis]GID30853.1 putative glutamate--cysteine ligase 2 [Actinoplanes brasiliensis]